MAEIRKIIHIDMDCFYAAVEMRERPDLKDKPIAVGGDGPRSVLCTCNYVARQFGVRSAMPAVVARQKCPDLIILPGNMNLYKQISQQIRHIFHQFTDKIEPLSLDEAYLDVSDSTLHNGSATRIAEQIREAIFTTTGLTASAGVSVNKFIAKVASDMNKPNGICVVTPDQINDFVSQLPVGKVPGVGKVLNQKLAELGIYYCAQLRQYNEVELLQRFGKMGRMLFNVCRGVDDREVKSERTIKSTSVETTFALDVPQHSISLDHITALYDKLKRRIDTSQSLQKLQVKVKYSDFMVKTRDVAIEAMQLPTPITYLDVLHELIRSQPEKPVRLIGIGVGYNSTCKVNSGQLALFES